MGLSIVLEGGGHPGSISIDRRDPLEVLESGYRDVMLRTLEADPQLGKKIPFGITVETRNNIATMCEEFARNASRLTSESEPNMHLAKVAARHALVEARRLAIIASTPQLAAGGPIPGKVYRLNDAEGEIVTTLHRRELRRERVREIQQTSEATASALRRTDQAV